MIHNLYPRRGLSTINRRVVKRWPNEVVLTDGTSLELWRECPYTLGATWVEGKTYEYVRPLNARELWYEPNLS